MARPQREGDVISLSRSAYVNGAIWVREQVRHRPLPRHLINVGRGRLPPLVTGPGRIGQPNRGHK
ncbi:MAG: hypothetical protein U0S49_04760 [Rhodospirillales bacterium]|nr:hypothetical protein [Rhodospirillales bacterium]